MCEHYSPCRSKRRLVKENPKVFKILLLDCWQREYDVRPYKYFVFRLLDFESRMQRPFNPMVDFEVILEFLRKRNLNGVTIIGLNATTKLEMQMDFVSCLFNLKYLELRMMRLPDCFFDQLLAHVHQMHLRDLILEGTELSEVALLDLRWFLIATKTLRYLNVNSCSITQMNFAILADGVHKCTSIRRFAFNRLLGNTLSLDSQKIAHTVSSLIWQKQIEEMEMQYCEFNAQDMEVISEYLHNKCSSLKNLNAACNIIGSDGAEYLFASIANSGTLTHLDISHCSLGTHGGDVVAKYLSSCFYLQFLNIRFNNIGASAINNILTMWKKRIKELSFKLFGNDFDKKSGETVNRLLKSRVLEQDKIDITATFDEDLGHYRIVPY